jgi:formylglycine-generating enzyme required for sulfatase activity
MLPCKIGREAEVVEQVAAVFAERRLQEEKRAEKERLARIRTCRDCNYRADKDQFSPDYYEATCKRCAKKRAKKTRTWALIVVLVIAMSVLALAIASLLRKERIERKAALISKELEQGNYSEVLSLDPKNAEALSMKNAASIERAIAAGDFETVLNLDPTNRQALAMKEAARIKNELAIKKKSEIRNAELNAREFVNEYERSPSDKILREALASLDQLESISPTSLEASSLRVQLSESYIAWLGRLSLEDAFQQIQSQSDLRLDQETQASAIRLVGSKLVERYRGFLSVANYSSASRDYEMIHILDAKAAEKISVDWLKIRKRDFDQIPGSVLSNLPPAVLANLPGPAFTSLSASEILELPPRTNSIGMKLKVLPPGFLEMGSEIGTQDELPVHRVKISKLFELGVYEVTQAQYEQVMGTNASTYKDALNPVEQVSWEDAVEFCQRLSALPEERAVGRVYRLPTEAEWEYACRAETTTAYSFGDDSGSLDYYAWFNSNSGGRTHRVGKKAPNRWGLHDMHGNVSEWCLDWYHDYQVSTTNYPSSETTGSYRVRRGGSWSQDAKNCRSAYRDESYPSIRINDIGFRVACVAPGQ